MKKEYIWDVSFKTKVGGLYSELFNTFYEAKEYYHEVITDDTTMGAMLIQWSDDNERETLFKFGDIYK